MGGCFLPDFRLQLLEDATVEKKESPCWPKIPICRTRLGRSIFIFLLSSFFMPLSPPSSRHGHHHYLHLYHNLNLELSPALQPLAPLSSPVANKCSPPSCTSWAFLLAPVFRVDGGVEELGESLLRDSKSPEALKPTLHHSSTLATGIPLPSLGRGCSSVAPFPFQHFLCLFNSTFLFVRKHVKTKGIEAARRALFWLNLLEWIPWRKVWGVWKPQELSALYL